MTLANWSLKNNGMVIFRNTYLYQLRGVYSFQACMSKHTPSIRTSTHSTINHLTLQHLRYAPYNHPTCRSQHTHFLFEVV